MGTEYYDFGAPSSRMVNVSSASRDGANVIVFGTRNQASFDAAAITNMTSRFFPSAWNGNPEATPHSFPFDNEMWIARATQTDGTSIEPGPNNRRYTFGSGPGPELAKIMKTTLPRNPDFVPMNHIPASADEPEHDEPVNGDFGHMRGVMDNPQAIILADPDGDDDLITARALTGSRGQYLNGLMQDLGIGDRYIVIKTAPYSKYGDAEWTRAVEATRDYRKAVFDYLMSRRPSVIFTDGPSAAQEIAAAVPNMPQEKIIKITRTGNANNSGIVEAGNAAVAAGLFTAANGINGKMVDIPRSHLSYYARIWEGTSGDRVITASGQYLGKAFAEVAPEWAYSQSFNMTQTDVTGCIQLLNKFTKYGSRFGQSGKGAERVQSYATRLASNSPISPSIEVRCKQAAAQVDSTAGAGNSGTVAEDMPDAREPFGVDDRSDKATYPF